MAAVPRLRTNRVLVIATEAWPLAGRISIALAKVGFRVAAVSPSGSIVRKIQAVEAHYRYQFWAGLWSIKMAIENWSPDLLVCCDDEAIRQLHHLHRRASEPGGCSALVALIEASLGDPKGFLPAREKSRFISLVQSTCGVRCPKTVVIPKDHKRECQIGSLSYPIVVKADESHGGMGVRLANNKDEAETAISDLANSLRWPTSMAGSVGSKVFEWMPRRRRTLCLQEYITGRAANVAVMCYEGRVLAGICVEVVETQCKFGPASVIRVIDNAEMTAVAETLVRRFGLCGFIGFDFILDSANQAWLIEMNPRATSTCALSFGNGADLAAAMFSRVARSEVILSPSQVTESTIVLFPHELIRSRNSPYLVSPMHAVSHDVPWEELELVRACLGYALDNGWVDRMRRKIRI